MPLMEARQDVFDQLASGLGAPVLLGLFRLEGEQCVGDDVRIDIDSRRGLAQRQVATAAEVQAELAEYPGGTRHRTCEIAEGLVD